MDFAHGGLELYGKNPSGHHMTNLCLHAANAILLFLLLLYMTGYLGAFRDGRVSVCAAPRACGIGCMDCGTQGCFVRVFLVCGVACVCVVCAQAVVEAVRMGRLLLCLRLMSKPMAVTLPFTLLLLDIWPLRRITFSAETRAHWFTSFWKLCVEKWPLFHHGGDFERRLHLLRSEPAARWLQLQILPLWERICNAAISYWSYVRITFWPDPLTVYYYYDFNHISLISAVLSTIATYRGNCRLLALSQEEALLPHRLAVVFGNAGAGDRHRAGRRAVHGRALYLCSADWTYLLLLCG